MTFLNTCEFDQEFVQSSIILEQQCTDTWSLAQAATIILSNIRTTNSMCLQCHLQSLQPHSCLADFPLCVIFAFHEPVRVCKVCFPWESVQPELDYLPIGEKQTQLEQIHFFLITMSICENISGHVPSALPFLTYIAQKCGEKIHFILSIRPLHVSASNCDKKISFDRSSKSQPQFSEMKERNWTSLLLENHSSHIPSTH